MEAQVAELAKQLASLQKRVDKLEAGGGSRPSSAASPARRPPSAASAKTKEAKENGGDGEVKKSPSKTSVKSGGSGAAASAKPPSASRRSSSDFKAEPIDPELTGAYFVGKRRVNYQLPDSRKGVAASAAAPHGGLDLEFIFGYNGKNCSNNLKFVGDKDGSFVYVVAATGVVHNPKSNTQKFFHGHNEDIVSFAAHPTRPIVATGQTDPKGSGKPYACLWTYNEDHPSEVGRLDEFHDRGICAIAFSPEKSNLIATVGMDDSRTLAVWDVPAHGKTSKKPKFSAPCSKADVLAAAFSPTHDFLLVTVGQGAIKVWTLEEGKRLKGSQISVMALAKEVEKTFTTVAFLEDGRCVIGGESGKIYVLDPAGALTKVIDAHKGGCTALTATVSGGGFVSAGADGFATFDSSLKETGRKDAKGRAAAVAVSADGQILVGTTNNSVHLYAKGTKGDGVELINGHSTEVWALAQHPKLDVYATAARNIKIHDSKKRTLVGSIASPVPKAGIVCLAFSPDGNELAAGYESGHLVIFSYPKGEVKFNKKLCSEQIAAINYSPNGQILAAGSWDQTVVLVETSGEHKHVVCKGHTSSITHLTFTTDSKYLASNSRDYEILYWNVETGKREKTGPVRNAEWADWQNILGWPVRSVFQPGMDGTDINAVNVSKGQALIAAANDMGTVQLFAYPALAEKAEFKEYFGHSSHVTNVRFSHDDKYLVSTGGNDLGVFQWRVTQ